MSLNFSALKVNEIKSEQKNNSSSILSQAFCENENFILSKQELFTDASNESTEQSNKYNKSIKLKKEKNNSIHKNLFINDSRKDLYGNIIEKGGKHKVSFKDDIKGNFLVELTIYHSDENCLKRKDYKKYTINRQARDREDIACCNIF